MYFEIKSQTGRTNEITSFAMFLDKTKSKIWEPPLTNEGNYSNYRGNM